MTAKTGKLPLTFKTNHHILLTRPRQYKTPGWSVQYINGIYTFPSEMTGNMPGLIRGAITRFEKENKAMIDADIKSGNALPFDLIFELKPGQVVDNEDGTFTILENPPLN